MGSPGLSRVCIPTQGSNFDEDLVSLGLADFKPQEKLADVPNIMKINDVRKYISVVWEAALLSTVLGFVVLAQCHPDLFV
ncbi:hypothetical protein BDQ12DRAFT_684213 [Crucibulum laeve]|uniref:Uncharacterized protein n=1 Tax=Crucibulum laeve TaxID=68775 RepID=A0A5C3LYA7_9AGAR|nr:hypothetical protein BDQ12DRAFT_684213 [Crucibulum laeve]